MAISTQNAESYFSSYNVEATTNYVYTSTGATGSDDGWVDARADRLAVQIGLASLNASNVRYRIEGKSNTYTRSCKIYSATLTSTSSYDNIINVTEPVRQLRIGVKCTNIATPATNNIYVGVVRAEVN